VLLDTVHKRLLIGCLVAAASTGLAANRPTPFGVEPGPYLRITALRPSPDGIVFRLGWAHPYRPGGSHPPVTVGHFSRVFTPAPEPRPALLPGPGETDPSVPRPPMAIDMVDPGDEDAIVTEFLDDVLERTGEDPQTPDEPDPEHHGHMATPTPLMLRFEHGAGAWKETEAFAPANRLEAEESAPLIDLAPFIPPHLARLGTRTGPDEAVLLYVRAFSGPDLAPMPLPIRLELLAATNAPEPLATIDTTSGFFGVQLRHPHGDKPRFETAADVRERWYEKTRDILANRPGRDIFVSPGGRRSGSGSRADPMTLDRALTASLTIKPGDTVWLLGGSYESPSHVEPAPPPLKPPDPNEDLKDLVLPSLDDVDAGEDLLGEPVDDTSVEKFLTVERRRTPWKARKVMRHYFTSLLSGTPTAPIIVRAVPGERVVLLGGLKAKGAHTWFWGFEIGEPPGRANSRDVASAVELTCRGGRLINLHIHGHMRGPAMADTSQNDREIYGCIMHDLGYWPDIPTHTEGFQPGIGVGLTPAGAVTRITDNVVFGGYGINVLAPAWDQLMHNVHLEGNFLLTAGSKQAGWSARNLQMNWHDPNWRVSLIDNVLYQPPGARENLVSVGYSPLMGTQSGVLVMTGNLVDGGNVALDLGTWNSVRFTGNVIRGPETLMHTVPAVGHRDGFTWDRNTYVSPRAAGDTNSPPLFSKWARSRSLDFEGWREAGWWDRESRFLGHAEYVDAGPYVRVRPNLYEQGRAHVAITAWGDRQTAPVDLSGVLRNGQRFAVFGVMDLASPVVEAAYADRPVSFPRLHNDGLPDMNAYLVVAL